MADQLYIEDGYVETSYFERVVDVQVGTLNGGGEGDIVTSSFSLVATVEIADTTGYYIPDYIEEGYIGIPAIEFDATIQCQTSVVAQGDIADTTGYYLPDYIEEGYISAISEVAANLTTNATVSCDATRIQQGDSLLVISNVLEAQPGKLHEADADFGALFTPSIVVFATKTGDVLIQPTLDLLATASPIRNNDATLENIVNLSLQNDRYRLTTAAFSTSTSLAITPTVTRNTDAQLASQFSQQTLLTSNFEAQLSSETALSANPISYTITYPAPRPIDWRKQGYINSQWQDLPVSGYIDPISFDSTNKQYGTHSIKMLDGYPKYIVTSNEMPDGPLAEANQAFDISFWIYISPNSQRGTYTNDTNFSDVDVYLSMGTKQSDSGYDTTDDMLLQIGAIGDFNFSGVDNPFARIRKADGTYLTLTNSSVQITQGTWHYIRLYRTSSGFVALFLDGANVASAFGFTDELYSFDSTASRSYVQLHNHINSSGFNRFTCYDTVLYEKGRILSNQSGFVTTSEPTNTSYTQIIGNFNNNLLDDVGASWLIDGVSNISATTNLSVIGGTTFDATTINLGEFTLGADANVIKGADASLATQASLTSSVGFVKEFVPQLDSIATQISVINKIGNTLVDSVIESQIAIDAAKTAVSASDMSITATASIQAVLEANTSADLNTAIDVYASAGPYLYDQSASVNIASTLAATPSRTRPFESSADANTLVDATATKTVDVESSINSVSDTSATGLRIQTSNIELDSIATQLSAAAKIGDFLIDAHSEFAITVDAVKRIGNVIAIDTIVDVAAEGVATRDASADTNIVSAFSADGTSNITAQGNFSTAITVGATGQTITDTVVEINSAMSAVVVARGNLVGEILADIASTVSTSADRTRSTSASADTTASVVVVGSKLLDTGANATLQTALVADGNLIVLLEELTYVIPREDREYTILAETREFAIDRENREYTILGG